MALSAVPSPHDNRYIVAGDWHAHPAEAKHVIDLAVKEGIDTIIHVGDFGFYDNMSYLKQTNEYLKRHNIRILAIDGNHEEFPYLHSFDIEPVTGLRPVRSHIYHLPRNTRWEWDGVSYLALGGAQSIDVRFREEGKSWWPEERITPEEAQTAIEGGHADVMFTHDAPASFPNQITSDQRGQREAMRYFGVQALADCRSHQELLASVTDVVQPHLLFHGHYHVTNAGWYRHDYDVPAYGISLNQGLFAGNTSIITPESLKPILTSVEDARKEEKLVHEGQ